jgi:hypothetical protein
MRPGITPTLAVRGRSSGEWRTVPVVNVLGRAGQRYLVAPRGDTQWVRNLRATGRGELRRRGWIEPFRATEIADAEKLRASSKRISRGRATRFGPTSERCRTRPILRCFRSERPRPSVGREVAFTEEAFTGPEGEPGLTAIRPERWSGQLLLNGCSLQGVTALRLSRSPIPDSLEPMMKRFHRRWTQPKGSI